MPLKGYYPSWNSKWNHFQFQHPEISDFISYHLSLNWQPRKLSRACAKSKPWLQPNQHLPRSCCYQRHSLLHSWGGMKTGTCPDRKYPNTALPQSGSVCSLCFTETSSNPSALLSLALGNVHDPLFTTRCSQQINGVFTWLGAPQGSGPPLQSKGAGAWVWFSSDSGDNVSCHYWHRQSQLSLWNEAWWH